MMKRNQLKALITKLFDHIINKAHKFSDIDNMYIQKMENSLSGEIFVTNEYYKDGKFKEVHESYTKIKLQPFTLNTHQ